MTQKKPIQAMLYVPSTTDPRFIPEGVCIEVPPGFWAGPWVEIIEGESKQDFVRRLWKETAEKGLTRIDLQAEGAQG